MDKDKYKLYHYWQQGDDLADHLEENEGDIPKALRDWAKRLVMAGHINLALADKIDQYQQTNPGTEIEIDAFCHSISIEGPEDLMEDLVEDYLIEKDQQEDDDGETIAAEMVAMA